MVCYCLVVSVTGIVHNPAQDKTASKDDFINLGLLIDFITNYLFMLAIHTSNPKSSCTNADYMYMYADRYTHTHTHIKRVDVITNTSW